jgi:arylsulfatase A-like enzyme/tetratricopeptide (TPR) repeat protein
MTTGCRRLPPPAFLTLALSAFTGVLVSLTACRRTDTLVFPGAPIVLVSIDTLRADHLPVYGFSPGATPHLDRFRRDAVLFKEAFSPCPMTLPSHVTMLTGLLPPEHGVRNNVGFTLDGSRTPHIGALLKARGYATGAAVSSYVLRRETGMGGLFDDYEDSLDPRHGADFADQQRSGEVTLRYAKVWIDAHAGSAFFYVFHIYEPHVPWDPPEPFRSRHAHPYDGEVAAADAIVGELLDHLRRQGIYDRAVIVVTSDHGEGLGDHGEEQHSILLYREAIRVPLLLKLPGSRRGGTAVDAQAHLIDLLPTLASLVGAEAPASLRGTSLLRLEATGRRSLYAETLYPRLHLGWSDLGSVVDGPWHYIHGPRPELYDMAADPGEQADLIARHPTRAAEMRAQLQKLPAGSTRAGAVDPATAEKLASLGYVGGVRDRSGAADLPNPREALPQLERMREGFRLASARRLAEAEAVLADVVKAQPGNVEAWIRLGETLDGLGRPADAAAAYSAALAHAGIDLPDVRVMLAFARLREGRLDEAAAEASRAAKSVPAKAEELLARVAVARGRLDEAERHAKAAASAAGQAPTTLLLGAEIAIRRADVAGALRAVEAAAARAKEMGIGQVRTLQASRADALARMGRLREAEVAYRAEVEAFPDNLTAWTNLAALVYAQGRRAEVEWLFEAMARANPHPQALMRAARTYSAFGEGAAAARWSARAGRRVGG